MPHIARHLAFAACFTLIGSVADAAPNRRVGHRDVAKAKQRHKAQPVDTDRDEVVITDDAEDVDARDIDAADETHESRRKRARRHEPDASDTDQVGFTSVNSDDAELVDAAVKVRKPGAKRARNWHLAIGPNVWLASVDANIAVGAKSVGAAIDFFQLSRHTKYGVPVLVEARYERLSFAGDVMYGVVGIDGANNVGPLMVKLDGTVKSLLVDGIAGVRLLGRDTSIVAVEARAGIRYQRTAISGSVGVSGNGISPAAMVDTGVDVLAGARVFVRPSGSFYLSGTVDQSLYGSSTSTWSAGVDANLRIGSRVLVAAGWRTLTQQKSTLSTVMHGPRVALQLLF